MPFIHVSVTKKLENDKKRELATGVGKLSEILPGKQYEKVMVRVDDDCAIYRGGEAAECIYTQTTMKRPNDPALQKEYVEKLYALYKEQLGLEEAQCYFAMVELDTWGSRGTLH